MGLILFCRSYYTWQAADIPAIYLTKTAETLHSCKIGRNSSPTKRPAARIDIVAEKAYGGGLPHVELMGNRQFYMERHRGILSYSGEVIDINSDKLMVRVRGQGLELVSMTGDALRIRGEISQVEWVV